jgi:outer membrane murein-binding lipoprotein Lpp
MRLILGVLVVLLAVGCSSTAQVTKAKADEELIRTQAEKIAKLEKDMERQELNLKMAFLKEQQQNSKQVVKEMVHTQCRFFCF